MKKGIFKIIGMVVIMVLLLQTNTFVLAETKEQLEKKQNENNKQINQTQSELEEVQTEKSETTKQVEELSTQIADYESQIETLNGQITELNSKITQSEKELQKAQEDYTQQEALLNARLVATYEAGETSYLDFLLSSESITDLISNYFLVTEVATSDTELLEKIQKQKEEIEQAKTTLENSKKELATSKASKQSVSTQLQTAKKEKNQQVAKLSEDEKQIQDQIDELQAASAKIEKEIKAAQARYAAQIAALNNNKNNGSSNSSNSNNNSGGNYNGGGKGILQRPVSSGNITTYMHYSNGSYHGALDYGVPSGTPVYAAADGVVITTANLTYSYGTHVVIQHAGGLQTWYAHGTSGSICVSPGQTVARGQLIMKSGNSGKSFGAHLHFEVRVAPYNYNTCRVDPRNYF